MYISQGAATNQAPADAVAPAASGDEPPATPGADGPPGGGPREDDDDDVNPFDGSVGDGQMWLPEGDGGGGGMVPLSQDTNAMLVGVGSQAAPPGLVSPGFPFPVDGGAAGAEAMAPAVLGEDGAQSQAGEADNTLIDRPVTCLKIDINYEVRTRDALSSSTPTRVQLVLSSTVGCVGYSMRCDFSNCILIRVIVHKLTFVILVCA